jgi:hypothetical protein
MSLHCPSNRQMTYQTNITLVNEQLTLTEMFHRITQETMTNLECVPSAELCANAQHCPLDMPSNTYSKSKF